MEEPNGLAFEYQAMYGRASGDIQVTDLVNDPTANGECRVFGLGMPKQSPDLGPWECRPFGDNRTNPSLITKDRP